MSKTYTCECCGVIFESEWSDADAAAEAQENFGAIDDPAVVCHDCFVTMTALMPPKEWTASRT